MNIFELLGIIAINNRGANKSIDETGKKAQGLQAKMSQAFDKIGKAAVKCGKIVGAAGVAAAGALLKSSVGAYAEFEQLEGGVKKLFGDDVAKTVMANANKAFMTAGLSANEYMQTVTSFSASLISSLGNDTAAAAELSDIAIQDMADNANTFGTDISMIQNAYQGFAKQNYTMLDNLKLGYGGTKEEMARLINDSGVMGKTFKATAKNMDEISFAKIIEAIHVVQGNMEIAGTTAEEASGTIAGSFGMWKASWQNLMTGLGDDENIEPLVDAFFEAGNTVLKNLAQVLPKIGKNLRAALVTAGKHIKTAWVQNIWPVIQKFFKAEFGVELPAWDTLVKDISNWWNNNVWPSIQNFFSTRFGIELPKWEDAVKAISTLWENIKTGIVGFFSTIFTVDTEDMTGEAIGGRIRDWWDKAVTVIGDIFKSVFMIGTEDDTGVSVGQRIKNWWAKALEFIGDIFCGFFRIDTEDADGKTVGERITDWWDSVVQFVGDIFYSFFEIRLYSAEDVRDNILNWWKTVTTGLSLTAGATVTYENGHRYIDGETSQQIDAVSSATIYEQTDGEYGGMPAHGAASGLRYVPYDNYAVRLHMGETVLPRNEAEEYRRGGNADNSALINAINALSDRVTAVMQQVAANTGARQQLLLNNGVVAGELAPHIDAKLGTLTARKERRG